MSVELLEKFQTGIVGLVGFAGVILTLFVNARISRRQAREDQNHERKVLAHALLSELTSLRRSTERNAQCLRDPASATPGVLIPAAHATPVFDANVARLGLLGSAQVGPVLEAYVYLEEFDRNLALLSRPDQSGLYRVLDAPYITPVTTMLESLLPRLDAAIAALKDQKR